MDVFQLYLIKTFEIYIVNCINYKKAQIYDKYDLKMSNLIV
jgi:hypothetical protein